MNVYVKITSIIFAIVFGIGLSTSLFAQKNVFHFCGARVEEKQKYYVTDLFQGKIKISVTSEIRSYLVKQLNLQSVAVNCYSFGNNAKPVSYQKAKKHRDLEIQKNRFNTEIELLVWPPE